MHKNIEDWNFSFNNNGKLSLFDEKIVWQYKAMKCVDLKGILKGNFLYYGCYDGFVYEINKSDGKLLRKYNCEDRIEVVNDNLFIGTNNGKIFKITDHALIFVDEIKGCIKGLVNLNDGYLAFCDVGLIDDTKDVLIEGCFLSSACLSDGFIYFVDKNGLVSFVSSFYLLSHFLRFTNFQTLKNLFGTSLWKLQLIYLLLLFLEIICT